MPHSLKAALDVQYKEPGPSATAACVLFEHWNDAEPVAEHRTHIPKVADYQPGQFYKRELPCLLAALDETNARLSVVLIDGHVWLERDDQPGLGAHLYEALERKIPVIGVAKSAFRGSTHARQVFRGQSQKPLFVTSVGIDLNQAAEHVASMAGEYRIPTLLKRVDALARKRWVEVAVAR